MERTEYGDFIEFEELQSRLGITEQFLFQGYLNEVFNDISERLEKKNIKKGLNKIKFFEFMQIPILISDKLFNSFDKDNDGFLSSTEFFQGLNDLYNSDFTNTVKAIFNILDFDKDSFIEKEDVKVIMSYLPLKSDNSKVEYKYQMRSLEEIDDIIKETFGNYQKLNFENFENIIRTVKSDVFLHILCFLYEKVPFKANNILLFKASKKCLHHFSHMSVKNVIEESMGGNLRNKGYTQHNSTKLLFTAQDNSLLSPIQNAIGTDHHLYPKSSFKNDNKEMLRMNLNSKEKEKEEEKKDDLAAYIKYVSSASSSSSSDEEEDKKKDKKDKKEKDKKDKTKNKSPSKKEKKNESPSKKAKNKGEENNSNSKSIDNQGKDFKEDQQDSKFAKFVDPSTPNKNIEDKAIYENWVYKMCSTKDKILKYYLCLNGKDIFYYISEEKTNLFGMHNLTGCFVKENGHRVINDVKFYIFEIIFPSKTREFYTPDKKVAQNFVKYIKQSLGYENFYDYYELSEDLGKGKFGLVKLGYHKKTKEKVAIKIINKSNVKKKDEQLVRTEIEILKICHHPNVVRLLDCFENAEFIFIVIEYLSGGDLISYLNHINYKIEEKKAAEIMFQLGLGVQYLQKFGIVHRDLKPANIMMDKNQKQIKIMDFNLSTIMSPNEATADGCGTLIFIAPEILTRKPYNTKIDVWSMGVMLYNMMSGIFPFDDDNDDEQLIANLIVNNPLRFPEKHFKKRSEEVRDLITGCLIKDPDKRLSIKQFLSHKWFKNFGLVDNSN